MFLWRQLFGYSNNDSSQEVTTNVDISQVKITSGDFEKLPREIQLTIFSHLNPSSFFALRQVCRAANQMTKPFTNHFKTDLKSLYVARVTAFWLQAVAPANMLHPATPKNPMYNYFWQAMAICATMQNFLKNNYVIVENFSFIPFSYFSSNNRPVVDGNRPLYQLFDKDFKMGNFSSEEIEQQTQAMLNYLYKVRITLIKNYKKQEGDLNRVSFLALITGILDHCLNPEAYKDMGNFEEGILYPLQIVG